MRKTARRKDGKSVGLNTTPRIAAAKFNVTTSTRNTNLSMYRGLGLVKKSVLKMGCQNWDRKKCFKR
jgi:hypothetical protein